ncbi:MAG: T9SS type A sorting domain-containing protein [Ginsengibacter sp.]
MKKKLLPKKPQFFIGKYQKASFIIVFLLIFSISTYAQNTDIVVPSSQVKLLKIFKNNSSRVEAPAKVDSNALYSNITTFAHSGTANGGAALQSGNTITTLVADSLGLIGTPPFSVAAFTFSVASFNEVDVTARARVRIYANDGADGGPGTLLAGVSFDSILLKAGSTSLFNTGSLQTPLQVTTQAIWAGIIFDNNNGTLSSTLDQLNNLGQGIFDPIDKGSSTDDIFGTDAAGSFLADNPTGSTFNFGGPPLANLGWEIISAITLPATLYNFKVQHRGIINTLTWNTSQEFNSNYFAVERAIDGIHFAPIGQVKAAGNSGVARSYQFNDANPAKGINYYRLRIVDIDNSGKYSDVITVTNTGSVNFTIYPNPVKNTLLVNMDAEKAEMAVVSITDINGRKVYNHQVTVTQGNNNFPIDVNNFSKGTYYLKVQLSNGSYTNKFNKL